jgi:hypothetical protein
MQAQNKRAEQVGREYRICLYSTVPPTATPPPARSLTGAESVPLRVPPDAAEFRRESPATMPAPGPAPGPAPVSSSVTALAITVRLRQTVSMRRASAVVGAGVASARALTPTRKEPPVAEAPAAT